MCLRKQKDTNVHIVVFTGTQLEPTQNFSVTQILAQWIYAVLVIYFKFLEIPQMLFNVSGRMLIEEAG